MIKLFHKRFLLLFFGCLVGLSLLAPLQPTPAHAAGQVQITAPMVEGAPIGHVGTPVTIAGTGFDNQPQVLLFVTTNADPGQCNPGTAPGMTPFSPSTAPIQGGAFLVNATWPANAATPTTPYYICAIVGTTGTLSSNAYTVAQDVSITLSQPDIKPGDQVTVTGANWVPSQGVNISILNSGGSPILTQTAQSSNDRNGAFSVTFSIPSTTAPGTYSVLAYAPGNPSEHMKATAQLTIAEASPTATAEPSPTATEEEVTPTPEASPTAAVTPTPTSTTSSSGGTSPISILIYVFGGIGIVLVIVGAILYIVFSKQ